MCGILVYLSENHKQKISTFSEALKLQENRGPDDSGIYYLDNNKLVEAKNEKSSNLVSSFIVGHNRLSIIDPSKKSKQPVLEDRKIFSYNGEFYNFKDYSRVLQLFFTFFVVQNLIEGGRLFIIVNYFRRVEY